MLPSTVTSVLLSSKSPRVVEGTDIAKVVSPAGKVNTILAGTSLPTSPDFTNVSPASPFFGATPASPSLAASPFASTRPFPKFDAATAFTGTTIPSVSSLFTNAFDAASPAGKVNTILAGTSLHEPRLHQCLARVTLLRCRNGFSSRWKRS
jgi:hypothetical protein